MPEEAPACPYGEEASAPKTEENDTLHNTRSRTLLGALLRAGPCRPRPSPLVLHIVGSDYREGSSPGETQAIFSELFSALQDQGWSEVHLLLVGPNVEASLEGRTAATSEENSKNEGFRVRMSFRTELYHDMFSTLPSELLPDMVVLFNAGLWGYSDWRPTLAFILQVEKRLNLLVTSYCTEEGADDRDVLLEEGAKEDQWLWAPEVNPHRSVVRRGSDCATRPLFENYCWQCLRLGRADAT